MRTTKLQYHISHSQFRAKVFFLRSPPCKHGVSSENLKKKSLEKGRKMSNGKDEEKCDLCCEKRESSKQDLIGICVHGFVHSNDDDESLELDLGNSSSESSSVLDLGDSEEDISDLEEADNDDGSFSHNDDFDISREDFMWIEEELTMVQRIQHGLYTIGKYCRTLLEC